MNPSFQPILTVTMRNPGSVPRRRCGAAASQRWRLVRAPLRNFHTAERRHVFAGFRTCAMVNA